MGGNWVDSEVSSKVGPFILSFSQGFWGTTTNPNDTEWYKETRRNLLSLLPSLPPQVTSQLVGACALSHAFPLCVTQLCRAYVGLAGVFSPWQIWGYTRHTILKPAFFSCFNLCGHLFKCVCSSGLFFLMAE